MNTQVMQEALVNMLLSTLESESFAHRTETLIAEHVEAAICRQLPKQLSAEYLNDMVLARLHDAISPEELEKTAAEHIMDTVAGLDMEDMAKEAIESHAPDINDLALEYVNDNLPDMDDVLDETLREILPHHEFERRAKAFVDDHMEDFTAEVLDDSMRDLDLHSMILNQLKLNGIEELVQQAIRTCLARAAIVVKAE